MTLMNLTDLEHSWAVNNMIIPLVIGVIVIIIGWVLFNKKKEEREILAQENAKKLKKIDDQWHNLYEPMDKVIDTFKKVPHDPRERNLMNIDDSIKLDNILTKIENESNYELEYMVGQIRKKAVLGSEGCAFHNLDTLSLEIKNKIKKLKDERLKYV